MMRRRQRGGGGSHLGLLLLASQVMQMGVGNIPPVTLATLGLNVYLFLRPVSPPRAACVSVREACGRGEWRRLFLSPWHHIDDWHLYFNMASLLWKGVHLERRFGGAWFAYLLAVFSLLTGVVYLLLEWMLTEVTQDASYSAQCAVGFSGVLFALKVLSNHYHAGGVTYVLGLPVSNRYASWAELVLIHLTSPGTSFVGHLAGILVGLLYTAGPLRAAMEACAGFVTSNGYNTRHAYYNASGFSGGPTHRAGPTHRGGPTHPQTHLYTSALSEQQQYEEAIRASLHETRGSGQGGHAPSGPAPFGSSVPPTLEEVRRRRLQRFDR